MSQNGVRATDLQLLTGLDEVLGNKDGTTGRLGLEALVALVAARIGPSYEFLVDLNADLDWAAGTLATVWGEADGALNGVYEKSGAAGEGAWTRIGGLPISNVSQALLDQKADVTDLEALEAQLTGIAAGLSPAGDWDPTQGVFPDQAAANTFYVASAAGTVDGQTFAVGDWIIALIAAPSTTTFAANWTRADYSAVVTAAVVESDEVLKTALNLSDLPDVPAARTHLGLGAAALLGTSSNVNFNNDPALLASRGAIKTQIDNAITAAFSSRRFDSGLQTFNNGFSYSVSHGLAERPRFVAFEMTNLVAEFGFAQFEVISVSPNASTGTSGASGFTATLTDTEVQIKFASTPNPMRLIRPDTGAVVAVTNANWAFRIRASL